MALVGSADGPGGNGPDYGRMPEYTPVRYDEFANIRVVQEVQLEASAVGGKKPVYEDVKERSV